MAQPRKNLNATLLADGRVLVTGGFDTGTGTYLATAEVFTPDAPAACPGGSSGSFAATGAMREGRQFASAALLPDGRVLIAGGFGTTGPPVPASALQSTEIWDPATGLFTDGPDLADPRVAASAVTLNSGQVLLAGGQDNDTVFSNILPSAEIYTPVAGQAGSWATAGTLIAPESHAGAALLTGPKNDGRVVLAGGASGDPVDGVNTSQLYTPPTTVDAPAAAFTDQRVGTTSAEHVVLVRNTGTANLFVTATAIAGADPSSFALGTTDTCTNRIVAPGASCQVGVRFNPHLDRALSASLAVTDNSAAGTTTVALSGNGLAPRVNAAALHFGDQAVLVAATGLETALALEHPVHAPTLGTSP
jgi:hypothetical protein